MKKIKWAVILIAALSIMFAGCSGYDKADDGTEGELFGYIKGNKYIKITNRTEDWAAIDLMVSTDGTNVTGPLKPGDRVVFVTSDTKGVKLGGGGKIASGSDNYKEYQKTTKGGVGGSKLLDYTLASSYAEVSLRCQADSGNDLTIYDIVVIREGATVFQLSSFPSFTGTGLDTVLTPANIGTAVTGGWIKLSGDDKGKFTVKQ
jgi:hypothetical protein